MRNGTFLEIQPKRKKMKSGKAFIPLFLSNNFIGTSTVLLRNILEEEGFLFDEDTKLRASEDFALWLKIAKDKHIAFVDEPVYVMTCDNISELDFELLEKITMNKVDHLACLSASSLSPVWMGIIFFMIISGSTG